METVCKILSFVHARIGTQAICHGTERFNAACGAIADTAFRDYTANKLRLQNPDILAHVGLSAQMPVRALRQESKRTIATSRFNRPLPLGYV